MLKHLTRVLALLVLAFLLVTPSSVYAANGKSMSPPNQENNKPHLSHQVNPPIFHNVSIHDPSPLIYDKKNSEYYVFGTHIEAAKSKDLMSWTKFTNSYTTPGNVLFGNLAQNLAGSFAWAGENDGDSKGGFAVWAPDVIWNKNYVNKDGTKGAYLMYYATSSTYKRSDIGFAVSKNVQGPYTYAGTIVYSGFTRMKNYDGKSPSGAITLNSSPTSYSSINTKYTNTNIQKLIDNGTLSGISPTWFNSDGSYNTSTSPNAIDPALFYDTSGNLWMTYGSWSGGIFMLKIDQATGKPVYPGKNGTAPGGNRIDRYFGIHISGGYGKSGEGSFVVYDKSTHYYYLYESIGWLGANGGYNMRVFRSKNPTGPYVDALGQNAVLPNSQANNANYGEKLMGNFLFQREIGDPGTGIGYGYVSPGGNSVYYDPRSGKKFLVFHTRFPGKGEYYELRIQQIYMNKAGWPVVSPYPYAGESIHKVNRQDIIGEYKFINHGKDTTATIKKAVYIHLNKNNTISGDLTGTWKKIGQDEAKIQVGGSTYNGVFVRDWDPTSKRYVMTFTAASKNGVSVWGSRLRNETNAQIVNDVYNDLTLGDTSQVTTNLTLPTEGTRHTQISWQTSNSSVVTNTGVVSRPPVGSQSVTATLTATISRNGLTKTKAFSITVLPYERAKLTAEYKLNGTLKDSTGNFAPGTVIGNKVGLSGGKITFTPTQNGEAAVFNGKSGVSLPSGLIKSNNYSVSLWLKPEQFTQFTTSFFGAKDLNNWVSLVPDGPLGGNTEVWSGSNWFDGTTGMQIPINVWTNIVFTDENNTLTVYVNGAKKFTGSNFPDIFSNTNAVFSLGVNYWDPPFKGLMDDLQIYSGVLSPSAAAALAKNTP